MRQILFVVVFFSLLLLLLLLFQYFVVWPRLGNPFVCQNPRRVCASHSPEQILGCAYTFCLHGQTSISCTVLNGSPFSPNLVSYINCLCANLLHSLIIWLIISSLSSYNLHLLFCCVLSILPFIWLLLMALFSAAIRRDSFSFFVIYWPLTEPSVRDAPV